MDKALLQISRVEDGWGDRVRAYKIVVNGEQRETIKKGETKTIEVDPGEVEVFLKIDWCRSQKQRFEAQPGSEAKFSCGPGNPFTALWRTTVGRANYMWFEPGGPESAPAGARQLLG